MTIGVRRYTSNVTRSMAFSLFYMILSIGLVVATPVIDIYRSLFQEPFKFQYSEDYQIQMTAFRMLYATSSFISLCKFLLVFFFLREFDFETDQEGQQESQAGQENGLLIMKEVIRSKSFWKFTLLMCLLTGVRMTLRHIDATLPKYMTREIGEDAKFGTTIMLNGLIIIVFTPLFTIFTYKYKSLDLIKFGTFITGFSPFILCFGASYLTCATFVIILTIGEAIWSPRVFDITFEFAQKNREGTYMALSYSPTYASILMSSVLSGILLQHYCPLDGEKNSQLMWFIIGCTTVSSPILIALLGSFIHKHDDDDTIQCFQKIKYGPLSKDDRESEEIDAPYPITFTNDNKKID